MVLDLVKARLFKMSNGSYSRTYSVNDPIKDSPKTSSTKKYHNINVQAAAIETKPLFVSEKGSTGTTKVK